MFWCANSGILAVTNLMSNKANSRRISDPRSRILGVHLAPHLGVELAHGPLLPMRMIEQHDPRDSVIDYVPSIP